MRSKSNNIPFVHNYCDRWCERCRFVEQCAVGSSEKLLETELKMELAETEEEQNKIVFQHVADNFAEIGKMLEQMIEEQGLDIEEIKREAKNYKEPELTKRQKELEELAMEYGKNVHGWTERYAELLAPEALVGKIAAQNEPEAFSRKITDSIEVVCFYCFFIGAKTHRACHGKRDDYSYLDDPLQSDFNGSAKIALIAVGRSIRAWEFLMTAFPEMEDVILTYLAYLQKLSRGLLIEFPDAMKFVRPGFDEAKYN